MKINLNVLPSMEALCHIRKWQKNRYKQGTGNGRYSGQDPYVHETNMMKKFIVTEEKATEFIDHLMSLNDKYAPYVEHFKIVKKL
jgi:hypothetical protein